MVTLMGKTSAPPLDGKAIRRARIRQFMTQGDVHEGCAAIGVKFDRSLLSYIESGKVKRPSLQVVRGLATVLGLEVDEIFDEDDEPKKRAA